MSQDRLTLVEFILEKELKERAARRRKWMMLGGAVFTISLLVIFLLVGFRNTPLRTFAIADLNAPRVSQLFREDATPIVVTDGRSGRADTIHTTGDYAMLVAAVSDAQQGFSTQETEEGYQTAEGNLPLNPTFAEENNGSLGVIPVKQADIMPSFPGGEASLYRFLSRQIRYPVQAVRNKVEGTVYVRFVVQPDGSVTDAMIMQGIGYGCDEEALRVVKEMPAWNPGELAGQKAPVYSSLAVNFRFL